MKTTKPLIFLSLLVFFAATAVVPAAQAADKPNLLVMGEDADKGSIARDNRVFRRVQDAIINQLSREFDVYDETAITLDTHKQGRVRRTDAELLDIARSVQRPPIDIVVMFSIYASGNKQDHATKIRTRVEGRVLNVKGGQRLDAFEVVSPREWSADPDCSRECILEIVGDYSKIVGNDVGAVLREKIVHIMDPSAELVAGGSAAVNGYTMIFDGFSQEEVEEIEEYLMIFDGYKTHRPTYVGHTRSEIWYESTIRTSMLTRDVNKTLGHLGFETRVQFSGNTLTVQRITKRGGSNARTNPDW